MSIFLKPYPANTNSTRQYLGIVLISAFVFLFLFIFKPFGLYNYDTNMRLWVCLGFGSCTAVVLGLNFVLFNQLCANIITIENWTVGKQIAWNCWVFFTITIANIGFSNIVGMNSYQNTRIIIPFVQVFLIGIFPVTAVILLDYVRRYRRNLGQAKQLHVQTINKITSFNDSVTLSSSNNADRLQLPVNDLLYITSADNYIDVFYRHNGSTEHQLLRGTLKGTVEKLPHPYILRCHRSYIVNLKQITHIAATGRGYKLSLQHTENSISVSKTYMEPFNEQFSKL